jgi:hypothetical protein
MSRSGWIVAVALVVAACNGPTAVAPDALELSLAGVGERSFVAQLSGSQEVPPNASRARGVATFRLSGDGTELTYRLVVANIENVTMAHIHLAPADANGPVVAWLYPDAPPAQLIPGRTQGVLAEGIITGASLVGPLAGQSLQALIDQLVAGNAYVNVHTSQYPPGEVRGQIR